MERPSVICIHLLALALVRRIRGNARASRRLDEIQAPLLLLTGKQVSKQELRDLLLEAGPDLDRLAARIFDVRYPLSTRAWRRVKALNVDWGVKAREEDINRVLYGWEG